MHLRRRRGRWGRCSGKEDIDGRRRGVDGAGVRPAEIRASGFGIDAIDDDPRQREYAVMRDTLATVKKMRSEGATRDEIATALGEWAELTDWAMEHPATDPEAE